MKWDEAETSQLISFINWLYRTNNNVCCPFLLAEALEELEVQCPLMRLIYEV